MTPISEQRIAFLPTTLVVDSRLDEPVRVAQTRRVELRPWTGRTLLPALETRGFAVECHGDMEGGPFEDNSSDLVIVATRP